MNLHLGRLVPARIRHRSRVLAICCPICGQWRKPRHIRIPAMVCRDCETTTAFQSWKPSTMRTIPAETGQPTAGNTPRDGVLIPFTDRPGSTAATR